jgi:flagellar protein FliS|tara:strand:- start:405 stop:812 length:408 start_codon:yes stop_codon:yes gene_type:complete
MNSLANKRALSSYAKVEKTKHDTNDPQELINLLFTGLTDRITLARKALADKDREARATAVTKSQKILFGLTHTLDFENGGELARNLHNLYVYCTKRLVEGHAKEDDAIFEEVFELMVTIRDAWQSIPTRKQALAQ